MPNILDRERIKYEAMWEVDAYHMESPGERYLPLFIDMASPRRGATVLDAGCGAGKGLAALRAAGFHASGVDLTVDPQDPTMVPGCLWHDLRGLTVGPFEWVYCTDVLEHIPTAFTMLVVSRLLEVAEEGVFLSVSFVPDQMGVWIGETLHETVQPFTWWRDALNEVGEVVEARDLLGKGAFLVKSC